MNLMKMMMINPIMEAKVAMVVNVRKNVMKKEAIIAEAMMIQKTLDNAICR